MDTSARRAPLPEGARRIPLNVTLDPQTHRELGRIGQGNRSAAIEKLVRHYLAHTAPLTEPA